MRKKQNFRKVPDFIWEKLKTETQNDIVVACSKQLAHDDIEKGLWRHLGLTMEGGEFKFPPEVIPDPTRGRYSKRNVQGHTVVRRDLPKVSKVFYLEAQSGRDGCGGTHTITYFRDVFLRDFHAPRELTVSTELLKTEGQGSVFKFTVNEVLRRDAKKFEERLFFSLNLLQENVGAASIFPNGASATAYLSTVHVDWELLPEGSREAMMSRLLQGVRGDVEAVKARIEARRQLLDSFHPAGWIVGTSGLRRYFGAKFREDLVVFENVEFGNAAYVLFGNWTELSRLSRIELMERTSDVVRIVHRDGWEARLKKVLEDNIGPLTERQAA